MKCRARDTRTRHFALTHTPTHRTQGAYGISGHDLLIQHLGAHGKASKTAEYHRLDARKPIGKDEVGSSNLPSSSKSSGFLRKSAAFLFK